MAFFTYKAINLDGEEIKGLIEGEDMGAAYNSVSSLGLYILNIRKSNRLTKYYLDRVKSRGIKIQDIIEFANNLSVMIRAGIPLLTALTDMSETMENKKFREKIKDIARTVELGSSLAGALSSHRDIFPDIFLNLVSVGEETGRLDQSLSDIVVYLQRMEDLKGAIKRALIYPTFAVIATTGALIFWLVYVLPKIVGIFKTMEVKLPMLTIIIIAASDFTRANWYLILLLPIVIFTALKLLSKKESTKYYIDMAKLKLPIVKLIVSNKSLALFAEQSRILLSAGLPIDRAFDITIKVVDNLVFRRAITAIREDILLGSRIHEAIKKQSMLFPNMVSRLIHIGEETGNLPEQLDYLSREFIKRLNILSQKMEKMIEPIVIGVVGGIFLLIIVGLLTPIYNLIAKIGGG